MYNVCQDNRQTGPFSNCTFPEHKFISLLAHMPTGEITSNWETNFRFRHHKIQSWVPAASYCNSRSEIYVLTQNNIDKATVYFVIVQIAD